MWAPFLIEIAPSKLWRHVRASRFRTRGGKKAKIRNRMTEQRRPRPRAFRLEGDQTVTAKATPSTDDAGTPSIE
ncbi:MAG: TIGR01620 family protein, partial [Methylocystis sp.]